MSKINKMLIGKLKAHLVQHYMIDVDNIDFNEEWDDSLTAQENINKIKRKYAGEELLE